MAFPNTKRPVSSLNASQYGGIWVTTLFFVRIFTISKAALYVDGQRRADDCA